jgi:hypothetical protein
VQTYANGVVVRWIGPPDADTPAPTVAVTEPAPEAEEAATPAPTPGQDAAAGEQDEGSDTLSIVALAVGIAALATGLAALFLSGRRREAAVR